MLWRDYSRYRQKEIVIVGTGEFGQIAYEYFTYDSPFEVKGFSAEAAYIREREMFGLPVVALEELERHFPPDRFGVFVAVGFIKLNRTRTRLLNTARQKGYRAVSYVSSHAFVWHNVEIGDNCFVFENNVVQYRVRLSDNAILWSGNHIGHRSVIEPNCFVSSHVVISGFCRVGKNCFFGVNSCVADEVQIAEDCVIGMGAVVRENTEPGKVYVGNPARALQKSSYEVFGVEER
ncbi:MAG: sugar O-acyltransferase [Planctomycetota bacterium]|nr:MAG: sugar O-acyltransferase [Planctomycetota bacterium]